MSRTRCKELFITFFKIGAFTFGGGYAMIPLIKREVVEEKKWLREEDMFDIIAIAESTPGPLAINAATFVGKRVVGFLGALCATLGVVLPSFLIIVLLSQLLLQIEHLEIVQNAFMGIRAGVFVLIANAFLSLAGKLKKEIVTYGILVLALALIWGFQVSTILVLIVCALLGILWSCYLGKKVAE